MATRTRKLAEKEEGITRSAQEFVLQIAKKKLMRISTLSEEEKGKIKAEILAEITKKYPQYIKETIQAGVNFLNGNKI